MIALLARYGEVVLDLTLQVTVILGAAALVTTAMRRGSASARSLVWTVAFAGVIASVASYGLWTRAGWVENPGEPTAVATVATGGHRPARTQPARGPAGLPPAPASDSSVAMAKGDHPSVAESAASPVASPAGPTSDVDPSSSAWSLLAMVWALGVAVSLVRLGGGARRTRQALRTAVPLRDDALDLAALRRAVGCPGGAPVLATDGVGPAVVGCLRPVVVIPRDLVSRLDESVLAPLLLHEFAHVSRKDPIVNALSLFVRSLFWHHPLAWIAHKEVARDREIATDGLVLRATRGHRGAYAEGLCEVVKTRQLGPAVPAIAAARGPSARERLEMVVSGAPRAWAPVGRRTAALVCLLACAVLPFAMSVGVFAQDRVSDSLGDAGAVTDTVSRDPTKPIERGLAYLKRTQRADGGWSSPLDGDVAASSLALLAYLGAGNTDEVGPHKAVVAKAIAYLVGQTEGKTVGRAKPPVAFPDHFLVALALSEAAALTKSPTLEAPLTRLLPILISEQREDGSWGPHAGAAAGNTLSTAWAMMALKSMVLSGRVKGAIESRINIAMEKGASYLVSMTDAETGRVGFRRPGELPVRPVGTADRFPPELTEEVTAAAVFARILAGTRPKDSPTLMKSAALLEARPASWKPAAVNHLHWYFGSLGAFQVGGKTWLAWSRALREEIAPAQTADGDAAGSWSRSGPWTGSGVISTALTTMCLETAYRYARVFK